MILCVKQSLFSLQVSTGTYPRRTAPPPPSGLLGSGPGYPSHSPPQYSSTPDVSVLATSPPRPGTFSIRGAGADLSPPQPGTTARSERPRYSESEDTLNLIHMDFVPQDNGEDSKDDADTMMYVYISDVTLLYIKAHKTGDMQRTSRTQMMEIVNGGVCTALRAAKNLRTICLYVPNQKPDRRT